jgi:uncharacterized protein (TIRG00374 family)
MRKPKTIMKRAIGLAITGFSVYLVMPSVIATFGSWPELQRLREGSLVLMVALTLLSLGCFWIMLGLSLRSTDWPLMSASQLASAAIARILPGGSATATGVQYKILNDAGIDSAAVGTGLTVVTLLNFGVLFAMPVFSAPAILFGPPVEDALVNGAIVAAISFAVAVLLGILFVFWNRPLEVIGNLVDGIARRFGRMAPDATPRAERLIASRNVARNYLQDRWYWVVLASFGKWGFDYLALVMAVRGTGHEETSSILLLAFVTASLLGRIPLTPGGLGFVEAGLTGTLVLAGLSAGDAATATLAYRLVSYWLPIPLGGLAYALYRLRMRKRGVEVPRLADGLPEDLELTRGMGLQ